MQTTAHPGATEPGAPDPLLTGPGFTPVGVLPLPACTAFAWFLLGTPPAGSAPAPADPVRAFLTTDDATAR
jgi:hypothetical protein